MSPIGQPERATQYRVIHLFGAAGEIAIGRSILVSLLRPAGAGQYREEWFLPKECQKFTYWKELLCMCAGAPLFPAR